MGRNFKTRLKKKNYPQYIFLLLPWFLIFVGNTFLQILNNFLNLVNLFLKTAFHLTSISLKFLKKIPFLGIGKGLLNQLLKFSVKILIEKFLVKTIRNLLKFSWRIISLNYLFSKRKIKPKTPKTKVIFSLPTPFKIRYFFLGFLSAFLFLFLPIILYVWLNDLPSPKLLSAREIPQTTKIYDRSGQLLYEIYGDQNRTLVPLSEIPDSLKKATIAMEDKDFYRHGAINPLGGILRAMKEIVFSRKLQGGSTITQQLVKSALLSPERTIQRKTKEIVLAFWSERLYSKDEILEMYLNQVPYGGTAWGVEAASQTYFGKHVKDLSLAEAALLAGLPAAPTTYSPFGAHPELAKIRQEEVLKRMIEDKYLTPEEAQEAKEEKLTFATQKTDIKAPHFVMYVKDQLVKKYGEKMVEQGGLEVKTTLDLEIQEKAQEIVRNEVDGLKNLLVGNGATLITRPSTGEILAMVGSKDYFDQENDGNVNVTLALRQPGSAIKPINYALALENGLTPASILDDSPITYNDGLRPYAPVNYDGRFHGKVPLRYALANSYNIPAVKVLAQVGVKNMIALGQKMGITSWNDEARFGLSLTLGGGDVMMLDMAKVYGTLANNGKSTELTSIIEVKNSRGEILRGGGFPRENQAISPEIAFLISNILADNLARSAAFGPQSALIIPNHTVAVKTGTTNEKRDNWTIGYTPSYVVTVWVGNNNNSPMHPTLSSGITGAAPIWNKIMTYLLAGKEDESFPKPENVVETKICAVNGLLPCDGCPTRVEYFMKGTEPKFACQPSPAPPQSADACNQNACSIQTIDKNNARVLPGPLKPKNITRKKLSLSVPQISS